MDKQFEKKNEKLIDLKNIFFRNFDFHNKKIQKEEENFENVKRKKRKLKNGKGGKQHL